MEGSILVGTYRLVRPMTPDETKKNDVVNGGSHILYILCRFVLSWSLGPGVLDLDLDLLGVQCLGNAPFVSGRWGVPTLRSHLIVAGKMGQDAVEEAVGEVLGDTVGEVVGETVGNPLNLEDTMSQRRPQHSSCAGRTST